MKRTVHQRAEEGIARAGDGDAPPQKRYFRQRAHINPLNVADSFEYPIAPSRMDWASHFPSVPELSTQPSSTCPRYVEVADVGCGFGGLLMGLSPALPDTLMVGMEIRAKVTEYVRLRILAARRVPAAPPAAVTALLAATGDAAAAAAASASSSSSSAAPPPPPPPPAAATCHNVTAIKTNAMKLLPRFFFRAQLSKLFFCFPDPHFKKANVRRRIINGALLAEYAYALRAGGRLYTITDVRDLHLWMVANCEAHACFARVPDAELAADACVPIMRAYTEEGQKVERLHGTKFVAVFRRLAADEAAAKHAAATGGDFWTEPPLNYEHRRALNRAEYAL